MHEAPLDYPIGDSRDFDVNDNGHYVKGHMNPHIRTLARLHTLRHSAAWSALLTALKNEFD